MRRTAILSCLLLSGCIAGAMVVPSTIRSAATWSSMVYAAKDGPIWVDVRGQGLGAPAQAFAAPAARAMTGAVLGYQASFTADPAAAPHRNFRVAVVLDPILSVGEEDACAGHAASRAETSGRLAALAVFCNNERPLSSARGTVAATSPADPAVASLMWTLANEIFRQDRFDTDSQDRLDVN
jgi:hypothetical protein